MNTSLIRGGDTCLQDKIALVTGGAQGIGRAVTERFQRAGAKVCIVDCDRPSGEATALEMTAKVPDCPVTFVQANLEEIGEIRIARSRFNEIHKRLDILVNNAGIELDKPFDEVTLEEWDRVQAINLRAPFLVTQALLPLFPPIGGAIINISSIHSTHAFANSAPYACSKAGLVALSRNLALELAPRHIRVNALCPGYIDTRLWENYLSNCPNPTVVAAETAALHPVGRRGRSDDVAQAALFLAADCSSFITGTQLVVDGGLTVRAHP
jgi:NAD(P)-dependent dehydrogenase (short-subunit alcohol dehydrogenase family)